MPSGRSKEDTWTEKDLKKAIQGDSKERKHKSRDKDKESTSSKDRSKERSSHKDKRSEKSRDDKEHRKRGDDDSKERRRHKEREKGDETKSRERSKDERSSKDEREKSRRDKDKDKERKKDRDVEDKGGDKDKDREKRRDKERDGEKKEKDRDKDRDKERRHRDREDSEKRHKDRKNREESGDKERKHNGDDEKARKRDKSGNRDKQRQRREDGDEGGDNEENRRKRDGSSKERRKDRESSSGKSRKHKERESSGKDKTIEKEKELEKQRKLQEELKRKKEEENAKKAEDENDYDYEDDFDDYEDDDFEDVDDDDESHVSGEEDENESESISKSKESKPSSAQSQDQMVDNGGGGFQGMMPQHSFLEMTQQEKAGLEELMQAISKENEKASTSWSPKTERKNAKKSGKSSSKKTGDESQTHGKINFVAASQKQMSDKAAKKTKKRGEELLGLIQLDVRSIELFDMPPMTEYELYMKRFGSSDSRQMFTQTNDENFDQECQTDDIENETRWCQHTSDSKSAGTSQGKTGDDCGDLTKNSFINSDSVRLNKFLLKASKVCLALLEEIEAGIEQPRKQYVETRSNLSDGYVSLGSSEFLVLGRDVCDITYSPSQTNMLLTAHGTSNVVKKDLKSSKGLLCVWNSNEPNKPTRLLVCESVPNSCCFGGANSSYAFAGMDDGVVAVWDLTEPAFYHESSQIGNNMLVFQNVTFTTAALEKKHAFPVVSVAPLTHYSGSSQADMSFQLATMDQSASVHIWTLVRTQTDNLSDLKNVGDDLGLAPHGRVKLVNSASITPPGVSISSFTHLFSMKCLKVNEANPSDMYAGTDNGQILHIARFTNRPIPKFFRQGGGSNKVNAVDLSPWKMPYMLACYDDGCVRLFHTKTEDALMVWPSTTSGASLLYVQWSRSRPSVFYTMDSDSMLFIWDLLDSDIAPVQQMKIQRKDKRAIGFTLANDYSALGRGSPGRVAEMALIFGDGSVEIHRLNKKWSLMDADELDRMESFLSNVT